jgi:hypothetical protein
VIDITAVYTNTTSIAASEPRGFHSIVKLNNTCDKKKSTFYIKDHQNRSIFLDIHNILHSKEL